MVGSEVAKAINLKFFAISVKIRCFCSVFPPIMIGSEPKLLSKRDVAIPGHAEENSSTTMQESNNPRPAPPYSFGIPRFNKPSS